MGTYNEAEDAKKAMEHLNGFELAGRSMKVTMTEAGDKVGNVDQQSVGPNFLDQDDERAGFDLGATGRLALMAKLAEGTGMKLPQQAREALNVKPPNLDMPRNQQQLVNVAQPAAQQAAMPPIATECFMHGGVLHIYVDKASPQGNVYVKCPNISTAVAAVNALHGRWFAGKVITAAYVPVVNYHNLFPDSANPQSKIQPRR